MKKTEAASWVCRDIEMRRGIIDYETIYIRWAEKNVETVLC